MTKSFAWTPTMPMPTTTKVLHLRHSEKLKKRNKPLREHVNLATAASPMQQYTERHQEEPQNMRAKVRAKRFHPAQPDWTTLDSTNASKRLRGQNTASLEDSKEAATGSSTLPHLHHKDRLRDGFPDGFVLLSES